MKNILIDNSRLNKSYFNTTAFDKTYYEKTLIWQNAIPVGKPTNLSPSGTYSGSVIDNGYAAPPGVDVTGDTSGTNAGTYSATYTPDSEHVWSDTEGREPVTITLTIARASAGAKPSTSVSKTYNGSAQNNGYTTPAGVNMTGSASGTNAGTYTATYTPDGNHKWSDNTTAAVTVTMTIGRASVGAKPATAITKSYTGSSQNNGYTKPTGVNMTGSASGTNGGTYSATYTPDSNHKWSDGTYTSVTRVLTIQYVWNKFNAVLTYAQKSQAIASGGVVTTVPNWNYYLTRTSAGFSATFNASTGKYSLTPSNYWFGSEKMSDVELPTYYTTYNTVIFFSPTKVSTGSGHKETQTTAEYITGTKANTQLNFLANGTFTTRSAMGTTTYENTKYTVTSSYSKGSTSYGTVANTTNSSAYPANGRHSDGYWYVKTW